MDYLGPDKDLFDETSVIGKIPLTKWMTIYFNFVSVLQETEEFLSNLVVKKTVSAKIDRLSGIIQFASRKNPTDILNDWSRNIQDLMNLVNKSTHLITKEEMVHKLQK